MKKILLFLVSSILVVAGVIWFTAKEKTEYQVDLKTLWLADAELKVEIADSEGERGQGLGGRKSLARDQAMLFIFEKPDLYPFWMRAMEFPLDIIWLDENYQVVDLITEVKPESYPASYFVPDQAALYVLETNAGWAKKNNVKVGSQAVFHDNIRKE